MCPRAGAGQCSGCEKIIQIDNRVSNLENWQRGSREFHEKFYEYQRTQIERNTRTDEKLTIMDANIKKLVDRQEQADQEPKKSMSNLKHIVLSAIVSAVITFIVAYIGLVPK